MPVSVGILSNVVDGRWRDLDDYICVAVWYAAQFLWSVYGSDNYWDWHRYGAHLGGIIHERAEHSCHTT